VDIQSTSDEYYIVASAASTN